MVERKILFFKSYSAKVDMNSDLTGAVFHLWSWFVGTHVATHTAEQSGQILILIKLAEKNHLRR